MSTPQNIGEVQVRIPWEDGSLSYLDELAEAFEGHLDTGSEFLDDIVVEDAEVCLYLYGPDPSRLIEVTRQALARVGASQGTYALQHFPAQRKGPHLRVDL